MVCNADCIVFREVSAVSSQYVAGVSTSDGLPVASTEIVAMIMSTLAISEPYFVRVFIAFESNPGMSKCFGSILFVFHTVNNWGNEIHCVK